MTALKQFARASFFHVERARHGIQTRTIIFLVEIFLLALCARLVYVTLIAEWNRPTANDEILFIQLGFNLYRGLGLAANVGGATAFRTPGYPFVLASLFTVFGPSLWIARAANVVLDAFTVTLLVPLGFALFENRRIGWLAALFGAFYPFLIFMTGEIYAETSALFLTTLALVLYAIEMHRPTRWRPAVAGLITAASLMVRPDLLFVYPFWVIWFWLSHKRKHALTLTLWLAGMTLLLVVPWTIRNYMQFREFIPLTTQAGVKLWQGNHALAQGDGLDVTAETWRDGAVPDVGFRGWVELGETASNRRFMDAALAWIETHPLETAMLVPKKIARLWSPLAYTTRSDRVLPPLQADAIWGMWIVFLLTAAWGAWIYRRQWRTLFGLYALVLGANLEAAITFGGTRYALPMAPALLLLGAAGLDWLLRWAMPRLRGAPVTPVLC